MILVPGLKLEAILSAAATPAPHCTVDYQNWNNAGASTSPATFRTTLSDADTTILPAPMGDIRAVEPIRITIYNADNANATVTVKTDNGTTEITEIQVTLATLETLHFERGKGWYATTAAGAIK